MTDKVIILARNIISDRISNDTKLIEFGDGTIMGRVGKKRAGRILSNKEWNEFPEVKR